MKKFIKSLMISLILINVLFIVSCEPGYNNWSSSSSQPMLMEHESMDGDFNTEEYDIIRENDFRNPWTSPVSTFSIDVDNASYSNMRRFLIMNQLPPKDAIRIEELVNYFEYDYPEPTGEQPFSINTELGTCPWNKDNLLLHIGIKGKSLNYDEIKPGNYVFLVDVSGSMADESKLSLVKKSLRMMVENLEASDHIALVVYAGSAGLVLPSTSLDDKKRIMKAIDHLEAGGSTAGGEGIVLAYNEARRNFRENGNNRVILATDGDFNVGISSSADLIRLIEEERKSGIYLTICGFGMGNYKDGRMEQISNAGNGNYFYIDNIREAEKVFSRELRANLFTIAKDVKIQLEFNPKQIKSYRLIGYENRLMKKEDFENDQKDAGELGAGHTVTALYELVLKNDHSMPSQDLKFQSKSLSTNTEDALVHFQLRYKPIKQEESQLIEELLTHEISSSISENFQFSAAVAGFGMLLRGSAYSGDLDYAEVMAMAKNSNTTASEDRQEFVSLVKTASLLKENQAR